MKPKSISIELVVTALALSPRFGDGDPQDDSWAQILGQRSHTDFSPRASTANSPARLGAMTNTVPLEETLDLITHSNS